jgi:lipoprotein NlpI
VGGPLFLYPMAARFVAVVLALCAASVVPTFGAGEAADDPVARAGLAEREGKWDSAVAAYDRAIEREPDRSDLYQRRGEAHFRLGHVEQSIADFDRYIKADSRREPFHWQRGISLYYAGRFADGRRQFERHQTVNPNDVENAAWHFACVARAEGVEKARAALLPIEGDPRVPMTTIYAMFAGRATPQDVLAATRAGRPGAGELKERLFYAQLYVGLYLEAVGERAASREHIDLAAKDAPEHYMGAVARVHAKLLSAQRPATRPSS